MSAQTHTSVYLFVVDRSSCLQICSGQTRGNEYKYLFLSHSCKCVRVCSRAFGNMYVCRSMVGCASQEAQHVRSVARLGSNAREHKLSTQALLENCTHSICFPAPATTIISEMGFGDHLLSILNAPIFWMNWCTTLFDCLLLKCMQAIHVASLQLFRSID